MANWMAEHGLTRERTADAIGISRRMLNYYLAGSRPIPKTVWLACLGWVAERKDRLAAA
jgi:transcriptional regulator with XRE-family HTH domain